MANPAISAIAQKCPPKFEQLIHELRLGPNLVEAGPGRANVAKLAELRQNLAELGGGWSELAKLSFAKFGRDWSQLVKMWPMCANGRPTLVTKLAEFGTEAATLGHLSVEFGPDINSRNNFRTSLGRLWSSPG